MTRRGLELSHLRIRCIRFRSESALTPFDTGGLDYNQARFSQTIVYNGIGGVRTSHRWGARRMRSRRQIGVCNVSSRIFALTHSHQTSNPW
jgi:hypothetical protein